MIYDFDPDEWYNDELYMIQTKLNKGEMTQEEYDLAVLARVKRI